MSMAEDTAVLYYCSLEAGTSINDGMENKMEIGKDGVWEKPLKLPVKRAGGESIHFYNWFVALGVYDTLNTRLSVSAERSRGH